MDCGELAPGSLEAWSAGLYLIRPQSVKVEYHDADSVGEYYTPQRQRQPWQPDPRRAALRQAPAASSQCGYARGIWDANDTCDYCDMEAE